MEVFKCDRCGKYFDTYADPDEVYKIYKVVGHSVKDLDLCDECTHDLKNWFNDTKNPKIKYSDEDVTTFDPNKRIDISEGLDPKTGEWGHNS